MPDEKSIVAEPFYVHNDMGEKSREAHIAGDMNCNVGWCNDKRTGADKGAYSGIFPLRCKCGGVMHATLVNSAAVNDDFGSLIDIECDRCGGDNENALEEDKPKLRDARLML